MVSSLESKIERVTETRTDTDTMCEIELRHVDQHLETWVIDWYVNIDIINFFFKWIYVVWSNLVSMHNLETGYNDSKNKLSTWIFMINGVYNLR